MIKREDIEKDFLGIPYQAHNKKRLEHLASLNLDLNNKSVLEVGAGIGCHTQFFIDRGCEIVSTDARDENIKILKTRYSNIKVLNVDLDSPFSLGIQFDIVYCYGTLYHLCKPEIAIRSMSFHCKDILLLETCVDFNLDAGVTMCPEDSNGASQSFAGMGCRPSRKWVFIELKRYFDNVYIPITQPDHPEFPIDWKKKRKDNNLTRAIFIGSRKKLDNNLLTNKLIMKQEGLK